MAKKQLIMEKALELFAKQGFEATSIQQITEHCGISKGAFYLSFKSKDELILALIDHFVAQILSDIDYLVINTEDELILIQFYEAMFQSFQDQKQFATVFLLKEQMQSFNDKFMEKIRTFDRSLEKIILSMIERLYGEGIKKSKYDLMYCIKGFLNTYSKLFLFYHVPMEIGTLSRSLAEKTDILAKYTTIPFISEELAQMFIKADEDELQQEQIVELIEEKIEEMEDSIEKESLILLKRDLLEPSFSPAIVKGLLENIRNHPQCKWVSYTLGNYYGL